MHIPAPYTLRTQLRLIPFPVLRRENDDARLEPCTSRGHVRALVRLSMNAIHERVPIAEIFECIEDAALVEFSFEFLRGHAAGMRDFLDGKIYFCCKVHGSRCFASGVAALPWLETGSLTVVVSFFERHA